MNSAKVILIYLQFIKRLIYCNIAWTFITVWLFLFAMLITEAKTLKKLLHRKAAKLFNKFTKAL